MSLDETRKPLPSDFDEDAADLARLGVEKQELKRNFNAWSLAFMCFCNNGVWEAFTASSAQALTSGGSSSMVYGYLLMSIGALIISLCISEYASMIPTAGGQYHYVAYMSPPRFRRIFSWYAGWITTWAWVLSSVAGNFATCMQISSYMILFREGYVYERWHTAVTMLILMTLYLFASIFGIKYLHHTSFIAMAAHTVGFLAIIIYLLVHTNPRSSATYVFTNHSNLTGWESDGVAWCIGLLAPAAAVVGWDSSTHMAEEMKNAARDLPKTMWITVLVTGVVTFPWVIALMFCIPDITAFLGGPVARLSPLVQLMYNVSGGSFSATVGMTVFVPVMGFTIAGPGCISATSRIIYSLAREGAFPPIFAKVNATWNVPIYAILVSYGLMATIPLIYIGNETAYYCFASSGAVVYIVGYCFPLGVRVIWGMEQSHLKKGPFTLGRFSKPLAIISLVLCVFLVVFMCLPTMMPATALNANYAPAVLVFGSVFLPTIAWFAYGRKTYIGVTQHLSARNGPEEDVTGQGQYIVEPKKFD
ncbi:amino acid/polyamine transporter I [Penicillium vulpinum]|uniref:Amino acid permease/ SLC12A domain-containing protein n=1 Tax=Penicillium vulpinum TaxID=29845 RepID=A0A1V6RG33_9EURO|nr:amino acid/polyamine transporter I [Penicillium vulpinum]KAJ5951844.1 amino acid/polyamine transporter I [Penicillium vulpinum]OQE00596.1 hypothetical protein PENVUL_c049G02364 [Penicillium vulpinum]